MSIKWKLTPHLQPVTPTSVSLNELIDWSGKENSGAETNYNQIWQEVKSAVMLESSWHHFSFFIADD